jgi:hypothetical protein
MSHVLIHHHRLIVTFGGLTSLTELSLAENQLLELPPSFGALKSLRKLSAESNWYRSDFSSSNTALIHLTLRLVLCAHSLRSLPAEFRHLSKLQMASFKNNQFREIPTSFLFLKYATPLQWHSRTDVDVLLISESVPACCVVP